MSENLIITNTDNEKEINRSEHCNVRVVRNENYVVLQQLPIGAIMMTRRTRERETRRKRRKKRKQTGNTKSISFLICKTSLLSRRQILFRFLFSKTFLFLWLTINDKDMVLESSIALSLLIAYRQVITMMFDDNINMSESS